MLAGAFDGPRTSAEVSRLLEEGIHSGRFPAGSRLPSERALVELFAVSRPVVREALRGLAGSGLVRVLPGKGSYVRDAEGGDLVAPMSRLARKAGVTPRDVVAARASLECAAIEAAVENATERDLAEVKAALVEHARARGMGERARTDFALHEAIVRASGNPVLEIMYQSIRPFIEGMMLRSQSDESVRSAGDPQHEQIYTALADREREVASSLMHSHITLAYSLYGDDLDRPLSEVLEARSL